MLQKLILLASILSLSLNAPVARGQWVQTKGTFGQFVRCFAVSGTNLFAGTAGDGVYLSTDSGASWATASTGLPANETVNALVANGANIFAGTDLDSIYLSTDNGSSWAVSSTGLMYNRVNALLVSGTNLYVAAYDPSHFLHVGVFRSTNNGASWTETNSVSNGTDVLSLTVSGTSLFAGTDGAGMSRSTDNGSSWTDESDNLMGTNVSAIIVNGTSIIAATYYLGGITEEAYVNLSTNNGESWTGANKGLANIIVNNFAMSGMNIFASTDSGVYLSTDNGASWSPKNTGLTDNLVTSIAVSGPYLFVGTYGSVVWRRPLSDFGISTVSRVEHIENSPISYPNPFYQSTSISFSSPEGGMATISIINILGQEVARLFTGELEAGKHSFTWDASSAVPGTYWCMVRVGGQVERVALSVLR